MIECQVLHRCANQGSGFADGLAAGFARVGLWDLGAAGSAGGSGLGMTAVQCPPRSSLRPHAAGGPRQGHHRLARQGLRRRPLLRRRRRRPERGPQAHLHLGLSAPQRARPWLPAALRRACARHHCRQRPALPPAWQPGKGAPKVGGSIDTLHALGHIRLGATLTSGTPSPQYPLPLPLSLSLCIPSPPACLPASPLRRCNPARPLASLHPALPRVATADVHKV